jgi:hypothetical protein
MAGSRQLLFFKLPMMLGICRRLSLGCGRIALRLKGQRLRHDPAMQ